MIQLKHAATTAVLCAALVGPANAQRRQSQSSADADLKEVQSYTLTTAALAKMTTAAKSVADAIQKDPKARAMAARRKELKTLQDKDNLTAAEEARLEALEKELDAADEASDSNDDAQSLADMERSIAKVPYLNEALRTAGLSAREFATFSMCALQAGMIAGMQKGGLAIKDLPPGVQPANVQFMKDHEKEFAAIQALMGSGK